MQFSIIDIETTGLSKHRHKITEIAAAKIHKGKIIDEFHSLVNPQEHIPSFITRLTGITDELVKDAPPIHEVLPSFLTFIQDTTFVAHNATFDYGFLEHNARLLDASLTNPKLCTRKLAYRLLPQLPSRTLGALCLHLGITNEQAHRARGDVYATVQLFQHFLDIMKKHNITSLERILHLEQKPKNTIIQLQ